MSAVGQQRKGSPECPLLPPKQTFACDLGKSAWCQSGPRQFQSQGFSQGSVGLFKIDRLFPDYVTQESAGKDTVHFALTEKGHRLVERALKAGRHYYCWQFLSRLNAVHVCASVRVAHRHDGRTIPFA
jgi:hypothetical protein